MDKATLRAERFSQPGGSGCPQGDTDVWASITSKRPPQTSLMEGTLEVLS